jgi:hypothetical protein
MLPAAYFYRLKDLPTRGEQRIRVVKYETSRTHMGFLKWLPRSYFAHLKVSKAQSSKIPVCVEVEA